MEKILRANGQKNKQGPSVQQTSCLNVLKSSHLKHLMQHTVQCCISHLSNKQLARKLGEIPVFVLKMNAIVPQLMARTSEIINNLKK